MHLMLPGVHPSCRSTVATQWNELVFFKNSFFLIHERIRKCIGKCDDKMAVRKEKSRLQGNGLLQGKMSGNPGNSMKKLEPGGNKRDWSR